MMKLKSLILFLVLLALAGTGYSKEKLEIQIPRGSEVYQAGSTITIKYLATERIGSVNIYLSMDSGKTFKRLGTQKTTDNKERIFYFKWTIPSNYQSSPNCLIKLEHGLKNSIYTISKNPFSIVSKQGLSVLKPANGDIFSKNTFTEIIWNRLGEVAFVDIYLSTDGGASWILLEKQVENMGRYKWKISEKLDSSARCKIKIINTKDNRISDTNQGFFTIK